MKNLAPILYKTYDCLLCGKMSLTPACAECDDFVENLCKKCNTRPMVEFDVDGYCKACAGI